MSSASIFSSDYGESFPYMSTMKVVKNGQLGAGFELANGILLYKVKGFMISISSEPPLACMGVQGPLHNYNCS